MKAILLLLLTYTTGVLSQTTHDFNWANDGPSRNQEIFIAPGDTVRWTWGSGTHNLRATSGVESFDSGFETGPGHEFSHTFNEEGTTNYVCDPHAGNMFGKVVVSATANIEDKNLFTFTMYPNPTNESFSIGLPSGSDTVQVSIYNYLGNTIKSQIITADNNKINMNNLADGLCFIRVVSGNKLGVRQLVKR